MQSWLTLFLQCALPVLKTVTAIRTSQPLTQFPLELSDNLVETQKMLSFLGLVDQVEEEDTPDSALAMVNGLSPITASMQAFVQSVNLAMQDRSLNFQRWRWQQEVVMKQRLATQHRELLCNMANLQRQTALELPEVHKILDHWPLRLFPSQLLETHPEGSPLPLRIFLAPPRVNFDLMGMPDTARQVPDLETGLAQRLREFLNEFYSLHDAIRPTEFLGGAWESKRFHGEASIKALFHWLKSEPTLILESEVDGEMLHFRMAYWGLGQTRYTYLSVFKLPYREFLQASAKARALQWQTIRDKLLALGYAAEEVATMGAEREANLTPVEKAEALAAAGLDDSDLALPYQISQSDWQQLIQFLGVCHCVVAGWMADIHHLIHGGVTPIVPEHFPRWVQELEMPDGLTALLETTVCLFDEVLAGMDQSGLGAKPELALGLARSLAPLPDKSLAYRYIERSLQNWLGCRLGGMPIPVANLGILQSVLVPEDGSYLELLADCFRQLGNEPGVAQVERLLNHLTQQPRNLSYPPLVPLQSSQVTHGKVMAIAPTPKQYHVFTHPKKGQIQGWPLSIDSPSSFKIGGQAPITLEGHWGAVMTLVTSPDGGTMVSSDRTPERSYITVWDIKTGKLQRQLPGHRKPIYALSLSPDGTWLASGSHKIKLWNLHTGQAFRTLFGHRQWVYALAVSPDGQTLVSGSEDTTIKLWNSRTGELQQTLRGHRGAVRSLIVSPDGQWLISGSEDHTVKLWHFSSGKLLHSLETHQGAVHALAISPNGKQVISGGAAKTLRLWDVQTGNLLQTLEGHSGTIRTIALSPCGQTMASACQDGSLKVWRVS
jgi:hypothetical protein